MHRDAFSSCAIRQVVGFVYGGITLANEMERSEWPYILNVTNATSTPLGDFNTSNIVNYCARGDNTYASISIDAPCPATLQPWMMNCVIEGLIEPAANEAPPDQTLTLLEILQQPSVAAFKAFASAQMPPDYLSDNPDFLNGCILSGAVVLIATFGVVQGAQGLGTGVGAMAGIAKGSVAASELKRIMSRASAVNPFDEGGAKPASVRGDIELRDVIF
eukprot:1444336-Prymnesium_polylepis.1